MSVTVGERSGKLDSHSALFDNLDTHTLLWRSTVVGQCAPQLPHPHTRVFRMDGRSTAAFLQPASTGKARQGQSRSASVVECRSWPKDRRIYLPCPHHQASTPTYPSPSLTFRRVPEYLGFFGMRFFDEGKAATCRDVAPLIARSAAVVHRVSISGYPSAFCVWKGNFN